MLTGSLFDPTDDDDDFSTHIPALSIAQLVQFNIAIKRAKGRFRHNTDKKTPLSIYIYIYSLSFTFKHSKPCVD